MFGVLLQTLPRYSAHHTFYPKASVIHGKVNLGGSRKYMGYAIHKNA
jgi:hypothetical protein